jgi:hypothetical protein
MYVYLREKLKIKGMSELTSPSLCCLLLFVSQSTLVFLQDVASGFKFLASLSVLINFSTNMPLLILVVCSHSQLTCNSRRRLRLSASPVAHSAAVHTVQITVAEG